MSDKQFLFSRWLLNGGAALHSLARLRGQSIVKDSDTALIRGLGFKVDSVTVVNDKGDRIPLLRLVIQGWLYSINNESQEFHILSFNFREKEGFLGQRCLLLSDLKILATEQECSAKQALRAYKAAAYLVQQIEQGKVPEEQTVLETFKLIQPLKNPALYESSGRVQSDWYKNL